MQMENIITSGLISSRRQNLIRLIKFHIKFHALPLFKLAVQVTLANAYGHINRHGYTHFSISWYTDKLSLVLSV